MPTPTHPVSIKILSSVTTNKGEKVKLTNLTKGGTIYSEFESDGSCIINFKDEGFTNWATGDKVIAETHGRVQGYKTGTLTAVQLELKMTSPADTASAAVDL